MAADSSPMTDATAVIHAGAGPTGQGDPLVAGPVLASTFHLAGDPEGQPNGYGRFTNPTYEALEKAIGVLEGAPTLVFSSGMGAISAVLGALVQPGDTVLLPNDGYPGTRAFAREHLARWGATIIEAPTAGDGQLEKAAEANLVWLETPSNPSLDVCDIARISATAHREGTIVVVDNTTATPATQKPLALGADISVSSDTKALNGHSDVLLGHVSTTDPAHLEAIHSWRTLVGAIPGPTETWLALRGLATLDVRLERQCANAGRIAATLVEHPLVSNVRYPGLPTHPGHELALSQMTRPGFLVGFTLSDAASADAFLAACGLIATATSFGGVHSAAERRARWGTDHVAPGFIRLSVGCEDPDDLIADIGAALDSCRTGGPSAQF